MAGPTKNWQLSETTIAGVDLLTDPMQVKAPKVLAADNVTLATPTRAAKRTGTSRLADVARVQQVSGNTYEPRTIAVKDARWVGVESSGRVLMHADNLLLSETGGQLTVRGYMDQMRITAARPQWNGWQSFGTVVETELGIAGDAYVMAFGAGTGGQIVRVGIYDLATNALLWGIFQPYQAAVKPRIATIPELSTCVLFYIDATVNLYAVPFVGPALRSTSTATYQNSAVLIASDMGVLGLYDVTVLGQQIVLAYVNAVGNIARIRIDASGHPVAAAVTEAPGAVVTVLAVKAADVNGRFLIVWGSDAGDILKARDYAGDTPLTAGNAATTIDATAMGASVFKAVTIGVRGTVWTILYEIGGTALENRIVLRAELQIGGAVTLDTTKLRHASIRSKMWTDAVTGRWYCVLAYESQSVPSPQVTYFVYAIRGYDDGSDPGIFEEQSFVLVGMLWPGNAGGVAETPFPSTPVVTGRTVRLALIYRNEQTAIAYQKIQSTRCVTIEHAPPDLQGLVEGPDCSYAPGGILWRIDESLGGALSRWVVSEAGFCLYPEIVTDGAATSGTGALTAGATYGYKFFYRDFTTGERSTALTFSFVAQVAGAGNLVAVQIQTLTHTLRKNVVIDVYRTVANPTLSAPYYKVGTVGNDPTVDYVVFTDRLADTAIIDLARDYLTFGEADELAPPANSVLAVGQGCAALAGFDDPATIWLTKPRLPLEPLRWGDALMAVADSPTPGAITALAWNGPELVVWRAHSIQILSGKGPDATGGGGTLEPLRVISSEIGCRSARTLVRTPVGWQFQAADGSFWELDSRALTYAATLTYIGADVEPLADDCLGAFIVHHEKQTRFVGATRTLVYHYDAKTWAPWSIGGISAAGYPGGSGLYLPAKASSVILQDDETTTRDDGVEYQQRVMLAAFRPQGVTGEITIRGIYFSGGFAGPHFPQVRIYYDWEPGFNETLVWEAVTVVNAVTAGDGVDVFGGPSRFGASQVYQFVVRPARERCMAVAIEILDRGIVGGELDDSFWLASVGFEWAPVEVAGAAGYRLEEIRLAE